MTIKARVSKRLSQLLFVLEDPTAIAARFRGCYFEQFTVLSKLKAQGVSPKTILDIGSSHGIFARGARFAYPGALIIAFEPLKGTYGELVKLLATDTRLECHNVALGDESRNGFIHRSEYEYSSSLLSMAELHKEAFPYTAKISEEEIRVEPLDSVLRGRALERPLLMKIDVQGYEYRVLAGASDTLRMTDYILCEISLDALYVGQPSFDQIYQFLKGAGFEYKGAVSHLEHPKTRRLLQMDGLFVRA